MGHGYRMYHSDGMLVGIESPRVCVCVGAEFAGSRRFTLLRRQTPMVDEILQPVKMDSLGFGYLLWCGATPIGGLPVVLQCFFW